MDIITVISELIDEYVKANANYVEAVETEEGNDYSDSMDSMARAEAEGVIQGLSIALVALGQDIEKIDSQFSIGGID